MNLADAKTGLTSSERQSNWSTNYSIRTLSSSGVSFLVTFGQMPSRAVDLPRLHSGFFNTFRRENIIPWVGDTRTKFPELLRAFENLPQSSFEELIGIDIPRTLQLIYDIRNKRDIAHLGKGIDPNLQDATIVVSCTDWTMAEFVRLYHSVPAGEAQRIIEDLMHQGDSGNSGDTWSARVS